MSENMASVVGDLVDLHRPEGPRLPSQIEVRDAWYIVCASAELGKTPLAVELMDTPLVLFRTQKGIGALLDRCPHRNVPLSIGSLTSSDTLRCAYHGWEFDPQGNVSAIPCLVGDPVARARHAPAYAALEQQGYIWVYGRAGVRPTCAPFRFPHLDDRAYTHVRTRVELEGTVHAVAENALDVPHTAFLHGGWFRNPDRRHEIEVTIRRWHDRCEAEYVGEPRPSGILGKLLAPSGGEVTHFDRFFTPGITEVEYRLGDDSHLMIHGALTPVSAQRTLLFGVVSFRLAVPLPGKWLAPLLRPMGLYILQQDAKMLRAQAATLRRFGEEKYASTEVDCLGPHIWKLLRDAARADLHPRAAPFVRTIRMRV